jgi:hypothetical protein
MGSSAGGPYVSGVESGTGEDELRGWLRAFPVPGDRGRRDPSLHGRDEGRCHHAAAGRLVRTVRLGDAGTRRVAARLLHKTWDVA